MNLVAKLLAEAFAHAPDIEALVAAVEAEITTIATGEGGLKKVQNAAAATAGLAASIGKIAGDAGVLS